MESGFEVALRWYFGELEMERREDFACLCLSDRNLLRHDRERVEALAGIEMLCFFRGSSLAASAPMEHRACAWPRHGAAKRVEHNLRWKWEYEGTVKEIDGAEFAESISQHLRDAKFGRTAFSRLHDNLYIVPECDEESHQPFDRVAAELACQHSGHLGLIDAHEISRGRLGQLPLPDGLVNLNDQAGLDQVFAGVGQAEVREDVSRTGFLLKSFCFQHVFTSLRNCFSRWRTNSISDCGVAIPALDFF